MADSGSEYTGKSVDEAISEGLSQLGLSRNQVDIEVVSRGSRGIFGLGSEPARVRITPHTSSTRPPAPAQQPAPKPTAPTPPIPKSEVAAPPVPSEPAKPEAPSPRPRRVAAFDTEEEGEAPEGLGGIPAEPADEAKIAAMSVEMLTEMVHLMGFEAQVTAEWQEGDDAESDRYLLLEIHGHDVSPLIGRRGETLSSVQYLVRLMVNQRLKQWKNIVVDVEHYKERRVAQLTQLAQRMADQVTQSGRAVSLEPMPANERRIVHLALRDHPSVYTQSSGEGDRRKVHIVAKT